MLTLSMGSVIKSIRTSRSGGRRVHGWTFVTGNSPSGVQLRLNSIRGSSTLACGMCLFSNRLGRTRRNPKLPSQASSFKIVPAS